MRAATPKPIDGRAQGPKILAGACLYLILNFALAEGLGPARFYFNLFIGVSGAVMGVVLYSRARLRGV